MTNLDNPSDAIQNPSEKREDNAELIALAKRIADLTAQIDTARRRRNNRLPYTLPNGAQIDITTINVVQGRRTSISYKEASESGITIKFSVLCQPHLTIPGRNVFVINDNSRTPLGEIVSFNLTTAQDMQSGAINLLITPDNSIQILTKVAEKLDAIKSDH